MYLKLQSAPLLEYKLIVMMARLGSDSVANPVRAFSSSDRCRGHFHSPCLPVHPDLGQRVGQRARRSCSENRAQTPERQGRTVGMVCFGHHSDWIVRHTTELLRPVSHGLATYSSIGIGKPEETNMANLGILVHENSYP